MPNRLRIPGYLYQKMKEYNKPRGTDDSETIYHSDGTVEFPISDETMTLLKSISDDPEEAILQALAENTSAEENRS